MTTEKKNRPQIRFGDTWRSLRDNEEDLQEIKEMMHKVHVEAEAKASKEHHESDTDCLPQTPHEMTPENSRSPHGNNKEKIKTSLYLSESLFRRLKVYCAFKGVSVTSFITELLESSLKTAILNNGNPD
jgi:hypothetical protein